MNIQIFGRSKCFDTKKAQRYFKERKIPFQFVDLDKHSMSRGELLSVKNAIGGLSPITREDAVLVTYLAKEEDKLEKLIEQPRFLRTPIVRNGKQASVGYCPDIWKTWELSIK